ncbi:Membrane protein [Sphingobium herbicidovorans NBRC 16415]|uniref:Membrane protein n=2 Tax=Sphingobium herbicidovorans TaxID=76947 RepID=A0A086P9Z2_SPHHM|nr:Membrane protein [Sphingobium herbicidovorans NBRC 16415]
MADMTDPMPVIQSLLSGLPIFLLHLACATLVWLAALALYMWITPHDEFALIRAGNEAAAISLGGAAIGLAIPLALCLAGSVNVWDVMIWGSVTLVLQLIAFRFVDFLLGSLSTRIEANERAAAVFLAMMKAAIACLTAAAVAG